MTDFLRFLDGQFGFLDLLKYQKERYPEWILFGITFLALSVLVLDPFNIF